MCEKTWSNGYCKLTSFNSVSNLQRLSIAIRMVNKGVQKDHLILAVNSMTCTGSLIGFNKSGYKALFRSLNVQIPFAEATLFVSCPFALS